MAFLKRTLHHKQFTPDELNCFQKYAMLDLDALAIYLRILWADSDQTQKNYILSSLKYEVEMPHSKGMILISVYIPNSS